MEGLNEIGLLIHQQTRTQKKSIDRIDANATILEFSQLARTESPLPLNANFEEYRDSAELVKVRKEIRARQ